MSALMIVDLKVKNIAKLKEYSSKTPAILEKFGGELVLKGKQDRIHGEGELDFDTTVVFKFPSKEAAAGWYRSPEYQELLNIRDEAMDSTFKIVS